MMQEYNLFFYPNTCHVCKRFGRNISLKRCANCTMISYCSKEHQRQHWSQHKDLCIAITNVLGDNRTSSLFYGEEEYNLDTWMQMKMNFMLLVGVTMSRKLEHYEEEMFKFLRACLICHKRDPKILEDCPDCPCVSFCTLHKNDLTHKGTCSLLNLSFTLDVILMKYKPAIPEITVPHFNTQQPLPDNIKSFISHYMKPQNLTYLSLKEEIAYSAEYLTRPLTLLFAMQKLGYSAEASTLIVHIIGANAIEINGIQFWEILLHWLPSITSIKVILVGPELTRNSISSDLCKSCISKNKWLSIETHGTLYENYANSSSFLKPDLIVGFNAGIHECEDWKSSNDTWAPSLRIVAKQMCPFILTSYTLQEAEREQCRLKTILGNDANCIYCSRNSYSSLRPYRDFETNDVYYQNQYIIIYKNINA